MKKDYDSTRIYRNTQKKGASQTYDTPSSSLVFRSWAICGRSSLELEFNEMTGTLFLLPLEKDILRILQISVTRFKAPTNYANKSKD